MMVYLIHFNKRFKHAQHYIGFVKSNDYTSRMALHRSGQGAKLLKVVNEAGISWEIVRTWPDADRSFERLLKNRKNARKLCPLCIIS